MTDEEFSNLSLTPMSSPFAQEGDRNTGMIATSEAEPSSVNFSYGFPSNYATSTGKMVGRSDLNELGYVATWLNWYMQIGGIVVWNEKISYNENAFLDHFDPYQNRWFKIRSLHSNNIYAPLIYRKQNDYGESPSGTPYDGWHDGQNWPDAPDMTFMPKLVSGTKTFLKENSDKGNSYFTADSNCTIDVHISMGSGCGCTHQMFINDVLVWSERGTGDWDYHGTMKQGDKLRMYTPHSAKFIVTWKSAYSHKAILGPTDTTVKDETGQTVIIDRVFEAKQYPGAKHKDCKVQIESDYKETKTIVFLGNRLWTASQDSKLSFSIKQGNCGGCRHSIEIDGKEVWTNNGPGTWTFTTEVKKGQVVEMITQHGAVFTMTYVTNVTFTLKVNGKDVKMTNGMYACGLNFGEKIEFVKGSGITPTFNVLFEYANDEDYDLDYTEEETGILGVNPEHWIVVSNREIPSAVLKEGEVVIWPDHKVTEAQPKETLFVADHKMTAQITLDITSCGGCNTWFEKNGVVVEKVSGKSGLTKTWNVELETADVLKFHFAHNDRYKIHWYWSR